MAYARKKWLDHVVEFPNRYTETPAGGNMVTEIPAPGEIIQQGTPQSAKNFNNLEEGVVAANEMGDYLATLLGSALRVIDSIKGVRGSKTLTNSQTYPFNSTANGGGTSVALSPSRDTTDYTVDVEVTSEEGGFAGNVTVYDKQKNGFKIRFDGSAKTIGVTYTVRGGAIYAEHNN